MNFPRSKIEPVFSGNFLKNMHDIITFGSATRDIFIQSNKFLRISGKSFVTGSGICLAVGTKTELEKMYFASGGGGTNTAATFAKQGFKVAFCGKVGEDLSGSSIIKELESLKIDASLIFRAKSAPTDHSVIFSGEGKERTILAYHGASADLQKKDIPWDKIKAQWLYLAPLFGKTANLFSLLATFAKNNKIKIAVNPGRSQLAFPHKDLENILKKVDILFLNQEEASLLTKEPYGRDKEIFRKLDAMVQGICVMTKGPKGVTVSDGKSLYTAPALKTKVIERTGAGDSFASGFLAGFIKSEGDIEYAIQLGVANAAACLADWGGKAGLLTGQTFKKIKVKKEPCLVHGLCQMKI